MRVVDAAPAPRLPWLYAVMTGMAIGVGYAASPVSVLFFLTLAGLMVWAGSGLGERERRWIWGLLFAAALLRVAAVAVLFLTTDHQRTVSFFWDGDGIYLKQRGLWIRQVWEGITLPPNIYINTFEAYGWSDYLYLLAYLQYLVGPSPYGMHLFNIAVFLATAVLLHRLVRPIYGRECAFIGFAVLLFLPTHFAWSVSALKESVFVFALAGCVACLVWAVRGSRLRRQVLAAVALVLLMLTIGGLRTGGQLISAAGLAAGVVCAVAVRRVSVLVLAALVTPVAIYYGASLPAVQSRVSDQLKLSAVLHIGNVRTPGHGYKLLDQDVYSADFRTSEPARHMTVPQTVRFIVRAFVSIVIVPLPWQVQTRSEMVFMPQQVLWYLMLALTPIGLLAGFRRDALLTGVLFSLSLVAAATIALNSGNVGTMVRHRDMVVPFLLWISTLGAVTLVSGKLLSVRGVRLEPDGEMSVRGVRLQPDVLR